MSAEARKRARKQTARQRRLGALALWLDVSCDEADSTSWPEVDAVFADRAVRATAGQRERANWRRTPDVLRLRYAGGLTYDQIGAQLRPPAPVSKERVRQIIARGLRVLRQSPRYHGAIAQELDDATAPPRARRP